jgi:ketosteroid isomerase-like protein
VDKQPAETRYDEQLQLLREGIEAWNRGDWEAALVGMDEDVEWRISQPLFDIPLVSHGHDGVREFWRRWTEIWEDIQIEPERTVPIDNGVAAFIRWRARGRDGVQVDQQVVFAFMADEDGALIKRFIAYWDPEEAVAELGL